MLLRVTEDIMVNTCVYQRSGVPLTQWSTVNTIGIQLQLPVANESPETGNKMKGIKVASVSYEIVRNGKDDETKFVSLCTGTVARKEENW